MTTETTPVGAGESSPAPDSSAFDLEAVYDSEISPLMAQIIEVCTRVQMPMLATFCYRKGRYADDPEGVDLCTTVIPRGDWQPPEIAEAVRPIRNGASCRPKLLAFTITRQNASLHGRTPAQGGQHG